MRKTRLLKVSILMALLSVTTLGADSLDLLGKDTFFCFRVNSFDQTLGMVDQYISGISPMPLGLSMLARMQLGGVLGSPELKGLNTGGAFTVFALPSGGEGGGAMENIFFGVIAPVKDFELFVKSNRNFKPADGKGIAALTPAQGPGMVAGAMDGYAVFTTADKYEQLASFMAAGSSGDFVSGLSDDVVESSESGLWVYVDVEKALAAGGEKISEQLNQLSATAGAMAPGPMPTGDLESLKDIKYYSLGLDVKADILIARQVICAAAGSEAAGKMTLSEIKNGLMPFSNFLQTDTSAVESMIAGAGKSDYAASLNIIQVMKQMVPGTGDLPEAKSRMAFTVDCSEDTVLAKIAMPKEHLMEVVAAGKAVQKMMGAGGMQGAGGMKMPMSTPMGSKVSGPAEVLAIEQEVDEPVTVEEMLGDSYFEGIDLWEEYLIDQQEYWSDYETRKQERDARRESLAEQLR